MPESMTGNFTVFSQEKLKSAVDEVANRRRRGFRLSLGAGAATFALLAGAVFAFFSPYRGLMDEHGIAYWPLLFLAPLSLGLIVFCIVYIMTLRRTVKSFRETLVGRIAEFIDPSIVHEAGGAFPEEERMGDLLPVLGGEPLPGGDVFRGGVSGAAARFWDLRMRRGGVLVGGLYFRATMERRFAMPLMVFPSSVGVSRSGIEARLRADGESVGGGLLRLDDSALGRQILVPSGGEEYVLSLLSSPAYANLEAMRSGLGGWIALSCRGDVLRMAFLAPLERADAGDLFDEFDIARCRIFCQAARLCVGLTRDTAARKDLWKETKQETAT